MVVKKTSENQMTRSKMIAKVFPDTGQGIKILQLILLLIWVTGCATGSDILREKEQGKGTSKVYPVNADLAWKVAETVFRWKGMDAIEDHRSEGYMLTKSKDSGISWGVIAGAWIEPIDNDNTKVTVITKKMNPTDMSSITFNETTFHEEFAAGVEILRGKPR
jgi:hypothetical protein